MSCTEQPEDNLESNNATHTSLQAENLSLPNSTDDNFEPDPLAQRLKLDSVLRVQEVREKEQCLTAANEHFAQVSDLCRDLRSFRDEPRFHTLGAEVEPYKRWFSEMHRLREMDKEEACCQIVHGVNAGDLFILAGLYMDYRGRESDLTLRYSKDFDCTEK